MIKTDKTETLAVKISPQEMSNLDKAWKKLDGFQNRSQFVKAAINHLAGETVCETKHSKKENA